MEGYALMTRNQIRQSIRGIIEDIEPYALDDSDLHIPEKEIDKAVDRIIGLWIGDSHVIFERKRNDSPRNT